MPNLIDVLQVHRFCHFFTNRFVQQLEMILKHISKSLPGKLIQSRFTQEQISLLLNQISQILSHQRNRTFQLFLRAALSLDSKNANRCKMSTTFRHGILTFRLCRMQDMLN